MSELINTGKAEFKNVDLQSTYYQGPALKLNKVLGMPVYNIIVVDYDLLRPPHDRSFLHAYTF